MPDPADPDIRQLRRVDLRIGETGAGDPDAPSRVAAVIDVETTGLNQETDSVIELAVRRFRFDPGGQIVEIGRSWCWREDPCVPLSDDIIRITGITNQDLCGHQIDDYLATQIIASADLVIAHNASFDRPMVEKRLTDLPRKQWACSCQEIDWVSAGFEGRSLGWLCAQAVQNQSGESCQSRRSSLHLVAETWAQNLSAAAPCLSPGLFARPTS